MGQCAFLFIVHGDTEEELKRGQEGNSELTRTLNNLKKRTRAVTKLKAQQKELERPKDCSQRPRRWPKWAGEDAQRTVDDAHAHRRSQSQVESQSARLESGLGSKRIWIDQFQESARTVKIKGLARSNENVAEFLKRLNTSRHFVNVEINYSSATQVNQLGDVTFYKFEFVGLVIYGVADIKLLAEGKLGEAQKSK